MLSRSICSLVTLVILVVGCGRGAEGAAACGFDDLVPPNVPCNQLPDDGLFQGICTVDCLGNVYPKTNQSDMQNVPGGRFYAVLFSPQAGHPVSLCDRTIQTFAGRNNVMSPIAPAPERFQQNEVRNVATITDAGDLFVRIDRRLDGPIQFSVIQGFDAISGYAWRSYAGRAPIVP